MQEPKKRYESVLAIEQVAAILNLPCDDIYQGDWPYVVAEPASIQKYIDAYRLLPTDDAKVDKQYILMQMMLQALEEQQDLEKRNYYWSNVRQIIIDDLVVHEYLLWYWCVFDNDNMGENWYICADCRSLWLEIHGSYPSIQQ